jgi:FdhD protein
VSAPSSLARDLAQASNMTLVGFLRGRRLNVYAGRQRIANGPRLPDGRVESSSTEVSHGE